MRIVFIGTGDIGLPTLEYLLDPSHGHELVGVVTQPDKPVGRRQILTPPPIKAAIGSRALPILQPVKIKAEPAVGEIAALKPDVIVVMAYGQILPRAVLELPTVACLNLHASLLPRHRGAAPVQSAIIAGDTETGITVMHMDEGLDTGDMLLQWRVPIDATETGGSLHAKLAAIAPGALNSALEKLAGGVADRVPQDHAAATYAPKLKREDGRINWGQPAALIERTVRAFDPWPGAFTTVRDDNGREHKLKIFRASVTSGPQHDGVVFCAPDASLAFLEAQLEGSRRMAVDELLRGHPWLRNATPIG